MGGALGTKAAGAGRGLSKVPRGAELRPPRTRTHCSKGGDCTERPGTHLERTHGTASSPETKQASLTQTPRLRGKDPGPGCVPGSPGLWRRAGSQLHPSESLSGSN